MNFRRVRFVALSPLLVLAACAGLPVHQALPDGARDKIVSTDIVAAIPQSEIYVFVPIATGGAGFGLLGALVDVSIDSARTSKAEAAVKPLRDALVDYDFDGMFKDQLKTSLAPVAWLGVSDVRVVRDVAPASTDNDLAASKAGAVLFTAADYHTSNDADILYINVRASLFANNDALRALQPAAKTPKTSLANTLYRDFMTFEMKLPHATDNRDANIAAWSADHGAATRAALKLGAAKIGELLAYDFGNPGPIVPVAAPRKIDVDGQKIDAVGSDADGDLARGKDGPLVYILHAAP